MAENPDKPPKIRSLEDDIQDDLERMSDLWSLTNAEANTLGKLFIAGTVVLVVAFVLAIALG